MKKWKRYLRNEKGAELIEAVLIYPVVFLCIGLLLYLGIYILQYMTVSAYAQKMAFLAAREISHPGYIEMITDNEAAYGTAAVEMADVDVTQEKNDNNELQIAWVNIPTQTKKAIDTAYRFWKPDPISDTKGEYEKILKSLVDKNSLMKSKDNTKVTITSKNYVVAQYVIVEAEQDLIDFSLLKAFGVETPKVKVQAMASATDIDEFIRNTDLVFDALKVLAKKLGIKADKLKSVLDKARDMLGIKGEEGK
ncbi:MAG: hypothetical protein MJ071_07920 [Oscillospiraceae bacterium]|nr:hypothetical protein [Oscillospiraceae bacterium]